MTPWDLLAWAVALAVSSIAVTLAIAVAIAAVQQGARGNRKRKSVR